MITRDAEGTPEFTKENLDWLIQARRDSLEELKRFNDDIEQMGKFTKEQFDCLFRRGEDKVIDEIDMMIVTRVHHFGSN